MKTKPREFDCKCLWSPHAPEVKMSIRVIEKSAYDKQAQIIDRLKGALKFSSDGLELALPFTNNELTRDDCTDSLRIIKETLADVKKMEQGE